MTKESILTKTLELVPGTEEYRYVEGMLPTITNINVAKISDTEVSITMYHHYDEMYTLKRGIDVSYEEFFNNVLESFDW